MLKKFGCFFGLFAYAMGVIGGIGYSIYGGSWVIALAIGVLAGMAFPIAKKFFQELTS